MPLYKMAIYLPCLLMSWKGPIKDFPFLSLICKKGPKKGLLELLWLLFGRAKQDRLRSAEMEMLLLHNLTSLKFIGNVFCRGKNGYWHRVHHKHNGVHLAFDFPLRSEKWQIHLKNIFEKSQNFCLKKSSLLFTALAHPKFPSLPIKRFFRAFFQNCR